MRRGLREKPFNELVEGIPPTKALRKMSFRIILREKGSSVRGGARSLEEFILAKAPNDVAKIYWSVDLGPMGSHNAGVGGVDIVPAKFFLNNDLSAFATYVSTKYDTITTYDEIYHHEEVKALLERCAAEDLQ